MRSYWFRVCLNSMIGVLKKRHQETREKRRQKVT